MKIQQRIDVFPMNLGFTKSKVDSNLYYNVEHDGIMILLLYVYDLFLIGKERLISDSKMRPSMESQPSLLLLIDCGERTKN